ncbi:MAG: major capsid protein, partial [Butyrivibrio sp.]|nr:major capsid protein [Butyrivibrio sp.]
SRGVVSRNQWNNMKKNTVIAKNIYVLTNGVGTINDNTLRDYLFDQTGVEFVVYSKRYKDETGATNRFIPDDLVVLFPAGALGRTWFGTTPEESDLMTGSAANVAITDTGVAVTTVKMTDPVNVETKVTQICLPSFEAADQVAIIDASTT